MSDPVNSSAASVAAQSPLSSDGAQADGAAATGTLNADGTVMVDPDTGLAIDATATTQSNGLLGDFTSLPVIEQVDRAGVVGWVLAAMALIGLVVFFYKLVGFLRRGADSQFFIVFADAPHLDGQYTIWGQVTEGMEYVDMIKKGAPWANGSVADPDQIVKMQVAADAQ